MLKIIAVGIDSHKPHPRNMRIHNEANHESIKASLVEFGQRKPIVLWKKYVIAGCGTLEAARALGWKKIQAVRADELTAEQAIAYCIADNKTTDMSEFDFELLAREMQILDKKGFNLDVTGFTAFERQPLLSSGLPDAPEGFDPNDFEREGSFDSTVGASADKGGEYSRFILIYSTPDEKEAICRALGIDGEKTIYMINETGIKPAKRIARRRKVSH